MLQDVTLPKVNLQEQSHRRKIFLPAERTSVRVVDGYQIPPFLLILETFIYNHFPFPTQKYSYPPLLTTLSALGHTEVGWPGTV